MEIKTRKGQIASGITWFVGFIIIFFIIILFSSFSILLAGQKNVFEKSLEFEKSGDLILALNFENFVRENEELPEKDESLWQKKVREFVKEKAIDSELKSSEILRVNCWAGIYYFENKENKFENSEDFKGYKLVFDKREGTGRFGTEPCNPSEPENFFVEFVYPDKKIALCIER